MIRVIKKKKRKNNLLLPYTDNNLPNTRKDNQTIKFSFERVFQWLILHRISKLNSCFKSTTKSGSNWCDSILKKLMFV